MKSKLEKTSLRFQSKYYHNSRQFAQLRFCRGLLKGGLRQEAGALDDHYPIYQPLTQGEKRKKILKLL